MIELKRGKPTDKVVGQIQRYMGWVKQNLAGDSPVLGLIVSPPVRDPELEYALSVAPTIAWRSYEVTFRLTEPPLDQI